MTDEVSAALKKTPAERALARIVAKTIWKVQMGKELPEDAEARTKAWNEAKGERVREAARIVRQLERAGVTISPPQKTEA